MKRTRAQAHKNKVAYKPEKYTQLPAAAVNDTFDHLCSRCQAKLLWRRQFRKYKARTVPGHCNVCSQKKVGKAYRKVCDECSRARKICAKCMNPYVPKLDEDEVEAEADPESATIEDAKPVKVVVPLREEVKAKAKTAKIDNEEVKSEEGEESEEEVGVLVEDSEEDLADD